MFRVSLRDETRPRPAGMGTKHAGGILHDVTRSSSMENRMSPAVTRRACLVAACALALGASGARAQSAPPIRLFKIVTQADEILVGVNEADLAVLGGGDPAALAKAIAAAGAMSLWQYAVRKASNGDLQQAPLRKVSISGGSIVRVEPYRSPLAVIPYGA